MSNQYSLDYIFFKICISSCRNTIFFSSKKKFNFNKAVFPGTQGGPLEHIIAGKAVALGEAMQDSFKEYAKQIVKNSQSF